RFRCQGTEIGSQFAMSGVVVRALESAEECHAVAELYGEIWATPNGEQPFPGEVLVALADSGNYAVGAFAGGGATGHGALVGGAAGWLGTDVSGARFLHSHVAGVRPGRQGRGIGSALKQHQRDWARGAGLAEVRWTFDPLIRRNAWFNLTRLGAVGVRYVEDFYGVLDDAVNAGDQTDRLVVHWAVDGEPTAETGPPAGGAYPVLDTDRDGGPVLLDGEPPDGDLALWLPEDIEALRRTDADVARRWRAAQRAVLVPAFARGYRAVSLSPDGWLRLAR
ncbi:MAG: GNAT family N-acetyltransferase, partial [Acidimicrobiales bacterium]|nr:GNAT family N-acetyltransferase [Acidimicrobiales bacterium]